MTPKRAIFLLILISLYSLSTTLAGQAGNKDLKPQATLVQDFRSLDLTEDVTTQLEAVVAKYRDKLVNAEADIAVIKAQMAKALLPAQPDREELKRLVKKSLEIEGESRLAQIERQIEIRNLLGEKRWQTFNRFLRDFRDALRDNPKWAEKIVDKRFSRNLALINDLLP